MTELTWIRIKANLNVHFWKMKNSLEEIEKKHPHRIDLITSMKQSTEWVGEATLFFSDVEKIQVAQNREISRLNLEVLQMQVRIKHLEKMNLELLENATL
jgi:hypothetical protein